MSSIRNLLSGGQMVAYYPALARAVGGIAPALFLQQIAHWEGYSNDGWVYRTQEELEEELAMTPKVQATCRRHLVAGGFMKEQHRAGNRLHYSVDWQKVEDAISTDLPSPKKTKASYGSNYVYLMRSPDIGYKIGIATDPEKRRKKLAFELDTRVDIVKAVMRTDAEEVESKLHSIFNDQGIRTEGGLGTEWFALSNGDVDRTLEEMLRDLPSGETPNRSFSLSQPEKPDLPNGSFSLDKSKDKSKDKKNTPKGVTPSGVSEEKIHNWFTEFCNRSKELGLLITPEDRKSVPKHLKTLTTKHSASDVEMQRVLTSMLDARLRNWPMSPQQALNKVRGIPSTKRKLQKPSGSIAVIGATEDDYAPESYIGTEDDYRIEDYR